ncbi:MAG TPA: adenylate/guanylate cyclase domain-containing protein, partial [Planctomycetota bacterium]|nr:adenylate/guanylate cyclase domain-containing protein [Planctomycetota bacterium]
MPAAPDLRPTSTKKSVLVGLLVGALVGTTMLLLRGTDALDSLEWRFVDTRTRTYMGSRPADSGIVLATIDGADLEMMKQQFDYDWPWPLDINALAFRWMKEAGVRAVIVDVLHFDQGAGIEERPPGADVEAAKEAAKKADDLALQYTELARASEPGGPKRGVVLAYQLLAEGDAAPHASAVRGPVYADHLSRLPRLDPVCRFERSTAHLPVVRLLRAAAGVGFANVLPDGDGTVRRAHPFARVGQRVVPSLPVAAALLLREGAEATGTEIRLDGSVQRLDEDGTFYVNFHGGSDTYPRVRASDMVLAGGEIEEWEEKGKVGPVPSVGTAVPEVVRNTVVIWGINAAGLKDVVSAPVFHNFPGPEFQATVLDNLLHGDGRVLLPAWARALILIVVSLLVGGVGGASSVPTTGLVVLLVLAAGWIPGFLLFRDGTVLDVVTPSLAVVLSAAGVAGFKLITEGRRNRWLEGTFGKYLSPSVIEALKQDPTLIQLGGRRTEITVLFSDIQGFTTISEKLAPEDLIRLLNRYLTRQSAEVLAEEGVIDKFIGDA